MVFLQIGGSSDTTATRPNPCGRAPPNTRRGGARCSRPAAAAPLLAVWLHNHHLNRYNRHGLHLVGARGGARGAPRSS